MASHKQKDSHRIAVDWGTSNLRVWVLDHQGNIVARARSEKGMGTLRPDQFEAVVLDLISEFLKVDQVLEIRVCGMAGAREGWVDAGYCPVPCPPPDGNRARHAPTTDRRISVRVLPGVNQADPADVMRGEETQIAGFLAKDPSFDGVICLPGTHTKWVRVAGGKILGFQTFMTGELFSLLTGNSILRHTTSTEGWNEKAFAGAVVDALDGPGTPTAAQFCLRAEALISHLSPDVARARLSGHLIGEELRAARSFWQDQHVVIIGDETIGRLYRAALGSQKIPLTMVDADDMTLAGLNAAFDQNGNSPK